MHKRITVLLCLLIAAALLGACGGNSVEQPVETLGVREALDILEDDPGRQVCIKGVPVAYFLSYTYTGAKIYSVYFSDSAADYFGEVESVEEISDDWIEAIVREKDELWQSVREIFDGERETEEYRMLFEITKSRVSGIYYDFVEIR